MKNVHFAIPEIYGDSLSYYEVVKKLVTARNSVIENYNTIPDQINEAVKNLDASQLFSDVLEQLINSIATDNTKSTNAVKVYKKHDLLYATFNETVNLYEAIIDFTPGTETELIIGTNIREVNISELFIELRKLIEDETQAREHGDNTLQNAINSETSAREQGDTALQQSINHEASAREQGDTALQQNITSEASAREQADTTLQQNITSEASAREQADTTLQNAINTEKSVRDRADTALQTKIDNGTLKIDELWTNNNASTTFASKTVNINTDGYKLLYILFKNYTFYDEIGEIIIPTNNSHTFYALSVNTNNKGNIMSRGVKIVSGGVKFDDAFVGNSADNKAMIPFKIDGVK